MRKVYVYYGNVFAGQLVEVARGNYEFIYDDAFMADKSTPPVSVNLPKSQKEYHADRIFPVFTNMLPEGANRRALCRVNKVDENDFFGMLEMICGMDAIGKFVLKRTKE
jgi:serine/threonine-protein kinase HipA